MSIPAGTFKARCLELMDDVASTGREVVITKRGRPVARLAPVVAARKVDIYGCMAGSVTVVGDIVAPIDVEWSATC
jgi:prevent-host-death family protein